MIYKNRSLILIYLGFCYIIFYVIDRSQIDQKYFFSTSEKLFSLNISREGFPKTSNFMIGIPQNIKKSWIQSVQNILLCHRQNSTPNGEDAMQHSWSSPPLHFSSVCYISRRDNEVSTWYCKIRNLLYPTVDYLTVKYNNRITRL